MEALDWLFQQFPSYQLMGSKAYKPTLENTEQILEILDHPERKLKFIHVAGSNGKGSVSSYLASILKESGLKVGLFTSPHIAHFSERIRVGGIPIENSEIERFVEKIRNTPLPFSPSFFEITFGMALEHFVSHDCDICVIETGLGGRLDATNVIQPQFSVVTGISLEHTNILGNTVNEIAFEKAGIIKPNIPVVLGAGCTETRNVFEIKASEMQTTLSWAHPFPSKYGSYFTADYQKENFSTVLAALEIVAPDISENEICLGIENIHQNTGFYGRMQIVETNPTVIYDVSHNPEGIQSTFKSILSAFSGELHVIYGSSNDKDVKSIVKIFPANIHFYGTEFSNERSMKKENLEHFFGGTNFKSTAYFDDSQKAMKAARSNASESDTILVIGSFFLLSDFF